MLFSSISFLFIFFPVVILAYFLAPQKGKNFVLLAASLIFYAWGEPVYVVLLLLSSVFNYFSGRDIEAKREDHRSAKRSLIFAIVINLLLLDFFQYYGFMMDNINAIVSVEIPYRELTVPIGISIYTLKALSYLIDIYRKEAGAQKKFVNFALYLALFPQMIAGPVERYVDMETQLEQRSWSPQRFGNGAVLFVCGLARKAVLADSIGILQEEITGLQMGSFSVLTAWIGCAAFAFRFYFELSGYADMAMGLGRIFGFDLHRNFYYPYLSRSISEFWKRWNVSVTTWFRVYVFEPMGGGEKGVPGSLWNLLIVGALVGFWYGAEWRFLWWGIYCGILLILEQYVWGRALHRLPRLIQHIYTIALVFIGWTFFFSPNLGAALDYIGVMFGAGASAFADRQALYFLMTHWLILVLCILGVSARGNAVIQSMIDVPNSPQGKNIAANVIYAIIFLVSLAFLVTGTLDGGMIIQF